MSWFLYHAGFARYFHGRNDSIILGYHHVLPEDDEKIRFIQPGMYVTTKTFEKHMRYLAANYDIVSLKDLVDTHDFKKIRRKCIITFDDGWSDNYRYAYPILKRYGIPTTIFVSTNMIGCRQWPWPDRLCYYIHNAPSGILKDMNNILKKYTDSECNFNLRVLSKTRFFLAEEIILCVKALDDSKIHELMNSIDTLISPVLNGLDAESPWLTWDEIRDMARNSVSFGAHTENHVILTRTSLTGARDEIICSKEKLSHELGCTIDMFSYPNGNYDENIIGLIKDYGFKLAVTTRPGTIQASNSPFELNRYIMHNDVTSTIPMLACRINSQIPFC